MGKILTQPWLVKKLHTVTLYSKAHSPGPLYQGHGGPSRLIITYRGQQRSTVRNLQFASEQSGWVHPFFSFRISTVFLWADIINGSLFTSHLFCPHLPLPPPHRGKCADWQIGYFWISAVIKPHLGCWWHFPPPPSAPIRDCIRFQTL